ncbi:MAG: VapC toxin family PIN domain ribonuclease [Acidimicrobiales bacterium]|nr:VapC toxin family PIN domain ribonuclease [Acidimicrobiales bacterium]
MNSEPAGLADTSVFITGEVARPLVDLPDRIRVSAVTIGELELDALTCADPASHSRRGDILASARTAQPVSISESIMGGWAWLVVDCHAAGLRRIVKLTDSLLAFKYLQMAKFL